MRPLLRRLGALLSLALAAAGAQAAVGLRELPPKGDDGPVTVFYPTRDAAGSVTRGPFHFQLAWQGAPARGNGRLVVLSHGSGGAAWTYEALARRFVEAGFTVAVPEHRGDNWHDHAEVGPASWKRRPAEVSRAIDAVAADARLAPLLQLDRVGVFGMSAGGHTALTLAGGRWSPAALMKHCDAHLDDDFPSCVGLALQLKGDLLDGPKKSLARFAIHHKLDDATWYSHTDPRVAAIVAEVPFAVDFDMDSLAHPRMPLGLVRNGRDAWLAPAFHVSRVLQACSGCVLVSDLPSAGHGSLMEPPPPGLTGAAAALLNDPPGFDRALVPPAHARIVAFFVQHLLP